MYATAKREMNETVWKHAYKKKTIIMEKKQIQVRLCDAVHSTIENDKRTDLSTF